MHGQLVVPKREIHVFLKASFGKDRDEACRSTSTANDFLDEESFRMFEIWTEDACMS
jgi:hypothetical protein